MEYRVYKYRIYPSDKQKICIINQFNICKQLYNELMALSIDSYRFGNVYLTNFDFNNYISGKYFNIYSQVVQNVSDRVHKAFQNFFHRVNDISYKKKGFPRFKSRVNSITFSQTGYKFISNKQFYVSKIGKIPIILHRIPKGKLKTITIKCNSIGKWFVYLTCEVNFTKNVHTSNEKVGIDVGIENFVTLSNGEKISNPRYFIKSEMKLRRLQRRLSRKLKGSNREKARLKLVKCHIKIVNQRNDFLHKLSSNLTSRFNKIFVEDLRISNMLISNYLSKHINDASWGNFIQMLSYKAVTGGGQLIKVNPRNTSKTCNKCGNITEMSLKTREFQCHYCGFACHRDINASLNIVKGRAGLAQTNYTPVEDFVRPL